MEKWCCDGIKWAFEERRERGIYVYAEPPRPDSPGISIGATFFIGFRAIDKDFADEVSQITFPDDCPVTINTRTGIRFCPWCGANLEKFYKKNYQQLVDEDLSGEFPI